MRIRHNVPMVNIFSSLRREATSALSASTSQPTPAAVVGHAAAVSSALSHLSRPQEATAHSLHLRYARTGNARDNTAEQ